MVTPEDDARSDDAMKVREPVGFRHRLRSRLVAVMALSGAVLLASGGVGLHYVDAIGETLHRSIGLTAPLLSDVLEITQAGRRARASVRSVGEQCRGVEAALAELEGFDARAAHVALDLGARAAAVGASQDLERILASEEGFVGLGRAIFQSCARIEIIESRFAAAGDAMRADLDDADDLLVDVDGRFAGEDRAERSGATQAAVPDPGGEVATIVARMRTDLAGFVTTAEIGGALGNETAIDSFAQRRLDKLRSLVAELTRLHPVLHGIGRGEDYERLLDLFTDLAERVLGDRGLFATQRALLHARAGLADQRAELGMIDDEYFRAVRKLEATARRLDSEARDEVVERTREAYAVVATTSVVLLLFALALSGDMARRITGPIEQFTLHVAALRAGDFDRPLPNELGRRDDEIGSLARTFARLTDELAQARRGLVAEAETRVHRQYDRLQAAIATMPQGFFLTDADERLVVWNDSFLRMYGFRPGEVTVGMPIDVVLERRKAIGACQAVPTPPLFRLAVAERRSLQRIEDYVDGRIMVITASPTIDGGAAITHEDITARRRAEAEIEQLARYDVATGLANRSHFHELLARALDERVGNGQVALLYLDLDHFKTINDGLGHTTGDRLLVAVAERLLECCGEWETVGRLGGDEFAILQSALDQPIAATDLARRLNEAVALPFVIDGHRLVVGASIGISVAPDDAVDADTLLAHADLALYRAKSEGRGVARFFEPEMDARLQKRRLLESDLREALEKEQFELHYQPLVGAASGRTEGFEALLRWRHPERGLVPPGDFISLAEDAGLIGEIGAWVLREATRTAATWPPHLRVSVNISPVQIRTRVLTLDVLAAVGLSGLRPHRLELEITEGVLLEDTEATLATLAQLRDFGVRIAMDDFGTGYSSLGYLRRFAFDKVKIDQSFVRDIGESSDSLAIVRAVTGLCSSLGITTTAEGVETEIQRDRLRQEGCDQFQGWLFGRPMPAEAIAAHLAEEFSDLRPQARVG